MTARSVKLAARRIWLKLHLWLGLTAGVLFVLLGLSGSLLVFDHAIDEWLNPELLLTQEAGARRSLEEVIRAARLARRPDARPPVSVSAPRVANGVWTVWFATGSDDAPKFTAVYVDPYSAKVTGQRIWGEDWMSWIYRLHFELLSGEQGRTIVGITGILMLVSIASGFLLWRPLWKHSWRAAFALRPGNRLNYDLHKCIGAASGAFLATIAFTGVYLEFPEGCKEAISLFTAVTESPAALTSQASLSHDVISSDQALAIAARRFPRASFCHFHPPQDETGAYEIALRQPEETQRSFGQTEVFIDQYSGNILAARDPTEATAADVFLAWQFPLHNGEAFGLAGRWVVFFTGLTPAFLYATGLLIWRRKSRSAARRDQRHYEATKPSLLRRR